ncbi:MAG: YbaK/EbsC family protein [Armatimonadota bacterium]|nr:YbaK/EbsC family protein [Armatimonadota bacterium]
MRHLHLQRPLVFIDLETTGISPTADRIVEIAMIKVHPDGRRETYLRRVNPGVPIPPESTRFHGITDADVAGAPSFAEIAAEVLAFIGDGDLAGFNIQRFDLPLLRRELSAAGCRLDMDGRAVVDAQIIYHRRVPRDLAAAYQYYCGKDLTQAHSAGADIAACVEVLDAQLAAYPDLPRTPHELDAYFTPRDPTWIDPEGRFVWQDDEAVVNFGPEGIRGRPLREVARRDPGFLQWILRKDFHPEVKLIVQDALAGRFPTRRRGIGVAPVAGGAPASGQPPSPDGSPGGGEGGSTSRATRGQREGPTVGPPETPSPAGAPVSGQAPDRPAARTPATERVVTALRAAGIAAKVLEFPQGTRTAQEAAAAVGTNVAQIVKSLVFLADGRGVLVLVSGRNRVDPGRLARVLGATRVERADADRVRALTGFAIGGVPPVGHATPLEVVVDEDLLAYDVVYASAGTPTAVFAVSPADLVRATGGRVAPVGQPQ